GLFRDAGTVVAQRAQAHAYARRPTDRTDPTRQQYGVVDPPMRTVTRGEVDHLDAAAVAVEHARDQDRRVGQVVLLGMIEIVQLDAPVAARQTRRQQGAKAGIGVEAWEATPDDARLRIDQRRHAAVADHAQVQAGLRRGVERWGLRHGWSLPQPARHAAIPARLAGRAACTGRPRVRATLRGC